VAADANAAAKTKNAEDIQQWKQKDVTARGFILSTTEVHVHKLWYTYIP
jgi:hypothetical protein